MQFSQQKAGDENSDDNNHASHGRHTHFLHVKGVYGCVTLGLGNLFTLEQMNEIFTEDGRDQQ